MKLVEGQLRLSATDLAGFLGCRHLTTLDRELAHGRRAKPTFQDPSLETLEQRGDAHERAYLEQLKKTHRRVEVLGKGSIQDNRDRTLVLMREGADVIAQAAMVSGRWLGYADFLIRTPIETESAFGNYAYEAYDTKLARETKAAAVLQLSLYSDILGEMQRYQPEHMTVVAPSADGRDFATDPLRVEDYRAYYLAMRRRFEETVDAAEPTRTVPDFVPKCESCRWVRDCERDMRARDHLGFVARSTRAQRDELHTIKIDTLTGLASNPLPKDWSPKRGSIESLDKMREQARVQLRARVEGEYWEFLPSEPRKGLGRLPEPSPGDIYFDFEGDPFVPGGGLEYLFGFVYRDEDGRERYDGQWAYNHAEEKAVFEAFVAKVVERKRQFPAMHVYHFAPYEPAAMRRLMLRHASCIPEVDDMLRSEIFVDLYTVVREGLRIGVESYSIKKLEPYVGFVRDLDLIDVGPHKRAVEAALELADGGAPQIDGEWRDVVTTYNKHDCQAAARLHDWLEARRDERIKQGIEVPRPSPPDNEPNTEKDLERVLRELREQVLALEAKEPDQARAKALRLLASMIEFHVREKKVVWWDLFRLRDLRAEDLLEEMHALVGLKRLPPKEGDDEDTERYAFPPQPIDAGERYDVHRVGAPPDEWSVGKVVSIDRRERCLVVARTDGSDENPREDLLDAYFHQNIPTDSLRDALAEFARAVCSFGLDATNDYRAGRDLLLRLPPRLRSGPAALERRPDESTTDHALRVALDLDDSVLAIQGPPGAGKTYTGASMIVGMLARGKSVGVAAVSHKVVAHLMEKVLELAAKADPKVEVRCKRKVSSKSKEPVLIEETTGNATIFNQLASGKLNLAGGTVWLWASADARTKVEQVNKVKTKVPREERVDYLFIDEAGQLALANALAASGAARNIVLLGDPRQLEQPQRGDHPDGADVSSLEHVLGEDVTIRDASGIFLAETRRLHPTIQKFTSRAFYEGRLKALAGLDAMTVNAGPLTKPGLYHLAVSHGGNGNESIEEVDAIESFIRRLRDGSWRDADGVESKLTSDSIMVVAPYNAQVGRLKERLGGLARVGTVDKFQGQEAPVVIVSMTASSVADAPRGIEFLLSPNRLNVATSRAKCACVLVSAPGLFGIDCRTPRQMKLANALCQYDELVSEQGYGRLWPGDA